MYSENKIKPFDSFAIVYKLLILAGFYKILIKPANKYKWIFHQMYRPLAFLVALLYNIQHLIFIGLRVNNTTEILDGLIIEIPQINLLTKFLALNLNSARIDKIHELMDDPIFAANGNKDEEFLLKNKKDMRRLFKAIMIAVSLSAAFWPASHIIKRMQDETTLVPSYYPFEINTWPRFIFTVFMETLPVFWVGHGHVALDCVIATYFSQTIVQLKMFKYNLEHYMLKAEDEDRETYSIFDGVYIDIADQGVKTRFVYYVTRYEKLVWYTREVNSVFDSAMSFQFLTSTTVICLVVYRMSTMAVMSVPFIFLFILVSVVLAQVFMYCYYGGLVQYESQSVIDAVYKSNWLSLSPRFRRLLLIAMMRWSRPLTPHVSAVVPLSPSTFVTIVKSAYTLYAVLSSSK